MASISPHEVIKRKLRELSITDRMKVISDILLETEDVKSKRMNLHQALKLTP